MLLNKNGGFDRRKRLVSRISLLLVLILSAVSVFKDTGQIRLIRAYQSKPPSWGWCRGNQTWPWRWTGFSLWPARLCHSWEHWPPEARWPLRRCPLQTAPSASVNNAQKHGQNWLKCHLYKSQNLYLKCYHSVMSLRPTLKCIHPKKRINNKH